MPSDMKYVAVIVGVLAAAVAGAPAEKADGRIINGIVGDGPEEFPYMVAVAVKKAFKCGGFIYSDRFVVTAASCFDDVADSDNNTVPAAEYSNILVTAGVYDLAVPDPQEQLVPTLTVKIHEDYDRATKLNDIAIIGTARPIVFNTISNFIYYDEFIDPVINNGANESTTMGWGAIIDEGLESKRLRKANYTVLVGAADTCKDYGSTAYNKNYMICAKSVGITPPSATNNTVFTSPCNFDEGSPLVQGNFVIGIFSKNLQVNNYCPVDPSVNDPVLFTRLSAYYAWLRTNAGQQPIAPVRK